jgi:hypothetical protein
MSLSFEQLQAELNGSSSVQTGCSVVRNSLPSSKEEWIAPASAAGVTTVVTAVLSDSLSEALGFGLGAALIACVTQGLYKTFCATEMPTPVGVDYEEELNK